MFRALFFCEQAAIPVAMSFSLDISSGSRRLGMHSVRISHGHEKCGLDSQSRSERSQNWLTPFFILLETVC
jgi:hypothetical protein